ncbi:MAG: hypothetical protein WC371_02670 [Parachlamydiales bacterium]|jgi:hypothetical protein
MKTLFFKIFLENWPRKLLSLILAFFIWMMVSHSMTITKTIHNVPIRITNLPPGKTIEGIKENNFLSKKISLTLTGNKSVLDALSSADIEVSIDAEGQETEWALNIQPKDIIAYNTNLDIQKALQKIIHPDFIIKLSNLATEKIPLFVAKPIGEAPKGYQFLDIWPYQLYVTLSGPEETLKHLKAKGLKITFNLNNISSKEIEELEQKAQDLDEVSYLIPENWKKLSVPSLSDTPFDIDDPKAAFLRIDFAKKELIAIGQEIPIRIYFPLSLSDTLNPDTYKLALNDFVRKNNGLTVSGTPLFVQDISRQFLNVVKDNLEIVIIAAPKSEREKLLWCTQFIHPKELEDRFIAEVLQEQAEAALQDETIKPEQKIEYLRNRFKNYIQRFSLYAADGKKLQLDIKLEAQEITVSQKSTTPP